MKLSEQQILERRVYRLFQKGVKTYGLIEDGDRILVGLSGGKDSLALLQLLATRVNRRNLKVAALHVRMEGVEYATDTQYLSSFAANLGVELYVRTASFAPDTKENRNPCFLCSWTRRKILFNLAQEMGFNKIALGHHMDDILHTLLMNQTFEGQFSTMPAMLRMKKFPITIIRPLCRVGEKDLIEFAKMNEYQKQTKLCPYERKSNRTDIKQIFEAMERINPEVRYSLWNALEKENKLIEL